MSATLTEVARRLMMLTEARKRLNAKLDVWEARAIRIPAPTQQAELELIELSAHEAESAWSGYVGELTRFNDPRFDSDQIDDAVPCPAGASCDLGPEPHLMRRHKA